MSLSKKKISAFTVSIAPKNLILSDTKIKHDYLFRNLDAAQPQMCQLGRVVEALQTPQNVPSLQRRKVQSRCLSQGAVGKLDRLQAARTAMKGERTCGREFF